MTEKKKVTPATDCKSGKHTFFVTRWMNKGITRKALEVRCQHCLVAANLEEIETLEWRKAEGLD